MKVAKILKATAIVEWVLGFILGILSGIAGGGYSLYSFSSPDYSTGFSIIPTLFIWVIFFIMGMSQYGFAELLEQVAIMRHRTEEQLFYLTGAVQHLEAARPNAPVTGNPVNQ